LVQPFSGGEVGARFGPSLMAGGDATLETIPTANVGGCKTAKSRQDGSLSLSNTPGKPDDLKVNLVAYLGRKRRRANLC